MTLAPLAPETVLAEVLEAIEAAQARYMVVGSVASTLWGTARTTQDADVVVQLSVTTLESVLARVRGRFYIPEGIAAHAVLHGGMFNVIHMESATKIDLIVPASGAARDERALERRRRAPFAGGEVWFISPEDCIVSKLLWSRGGECVLQLRDVVGVLRVQGTQLDAAYLDQAAEEAGVGEPLRRARGVAAL